MTYKPVLVLDVDGVIINSQLGGKGKWYQYLLDDLGVDPALLKQEFFEPSWNDIVCGRRDLKQTLKPVLHRLNPQISVDDLLDYWFRKDSLIDAEVISVAAEWSRRTDSSPWLVSNQEALRARYLWHDLDLRAHFRGFIYSAELGLTKSSVEFFYIASKRIFGDGPWSAIYFDDDRTNVDTAKQASWDAYLYRGAKDLATVLSEKII